MEKKNRLSHSAVNTYMTCPKRYYHHYIDKLREKVISGALLFGSALDAGVNSLLLGKSDTGEEEFIKSWEYAEINKRREFLPGNSLVVYAKTDFDSEILKEDDEKILYEFASTLIPDHLVLDSVKILESTGKAPDLKSISDLYKIVNERKLNKSANENELKFLNHCNWRCLRIKGLLMLHAYKQEVMPNIKKVVAVQSWISVKNDEGDEIIGVVDLIAEWKDAGVIIFDNKTSSRAYESDAVEFSPQLTLYVHSLENKYKTKKAGFIVMNKNINKQRKKQCKKCANDGTGDRHKTCANIIEGERCGGVWDEVIDPKCNIQILIQEIPQRTEEIVLDNFNHVNNAIKQEVFPRNFNSCEGGFGLCPYINLCWKGKKDGLEKV